MRKHCRSALVPLCLTLGASAAAGQTQQTRVTSPVQHFGHEIGADSVVMSYTQFLTYWQMLAHESDRMVLDTIGRTTEGRPQVMGIVTAPANHRQLARYRDIARRLAQAEELSEVEARQLAAEGKAVVLIAGGLHSVELLSAQQLLETVYQLVSRDDAETRRILDDVIVLAVHANPDGMDLVADWVQRHPLEDGHIRGLPRLYQKYTGHDNNRDFYASTQAETKNLNRVMYTEWYPQIVYDHHQGTQGIVMAAPPFEDPVNHHLDPLILPSVDLFGAAMHERFLREGKPGVARLRFSMWHNGMLSRTPLFHNMIGLLTETFGSPIPGWIAVDPGRQAPHSALPAPIDPQLWRFRQSVDYSVSANYAVLDLASRRRDALLYNIYRMGRNAIERGSRDSWTRYPRHVAAAEQAAAAVAPPHIGGAADSLRGRRFLEVLHDPAGRDARGYILPADQPDFLTAAKFVDALLESGVVVHRAARDFVVHGTRYPAGSFVVKTAQANRAHVLDMFEPQDFPVVTRCPACGPQGTGDLTGWTLAFQMGVRFDRILDGFEGPFERLTGLRAPRPAGRVVGTGTAGYLLSRQANDAFLAAHRLVRAGHRVSWLREAVRAGGTTWPAGTFFIAHSARTQAAVTRLAAETGLVFTATTHRPPGAHPRLRPIRVGLVDRPGGLMEVGWTRFIFEQFEVPFEVVPLPALDTVELRRYGALVFVSGLLPWGAGGTFEGTMARLRAFLHAGGTIVALGSSAEGLAHQLALPVNDRGTTSVGSESPAEPFLSSGALLQAQVDTTLPIAHGLPRQVDVMFLRGTPIFRISQPGAVRPIAWFGSASPLRSGWAKGTQSLQGASALAEADVGRGRVYLFGPELLFRAQSHGVFRFVFNALYVMAGERGRVR